MNYVRSKVKVMVNKIKLKAHKVKIKSRCRGRFEFQRGIVNAVEALREAGAEVVGVVAIFTYGLAKADDMFKQANLPFYTLK